MIRDGIKGVLIVSKPVKEGKIVALRDLMAKAGCGVIPKQDINRVMSQLQY